MDGAQAHTSTPPVLVLGAGVNGLCLARELALNGVPVVVVDRADLGGGATAKSSRLIHGGLRYLEYGEFSLVRESLEERARLLQCARHFVAPLKLHIPVRRRSGGLIRAGVRFCGGARMTWLQRLLDRLHISPERGLWAARIGLSMYDFIARHGELPRHTVDRLSATQGPPIDRQQYRWVCSYWDGQMAVPERFCLALIEDTRHAARETGTPFELLTYHEARLVEGGVSLTPVLVPSPASPRVIRPAIIVNATGAWGDLTLAGLPVEAPRLFGGTRGSHIITRQERMRQALNGEAIYAEAPDGRLVFLLPWNGAVLIGTTDERFEGPPDEAIATEDEIDYLVGMVNLVLPEVQLHRDDVVCHYSGVRPLPYVPAGRTAAITRDHAIDTRTTPEGLRIETLVGGKLTTCRALGEQTADRVLAVLGRERTAGTQERPLPGCRDYPATPADVAAAIQRLERNFPLSPESAAAVWTLFGTEAAAVLSQALTSDAARTPLTGTDLPVGVIDWIITHEQARTVADLVERRLLLVFSPQLEWATLVALEERIRSIRGTCPRGAREAAASLRHHYGLDIPVG